MTALVEGRSLKLTQGRDADSNGASLKTVSVIIPFSKPATVGAAIDSVLAQDYPAAMVQIIVVGKGSDALRERWPQIETIDIGPIREPGRARNLGAKRATGEILLFLDDDCEAQEGWIRENLAELENPEVGAVSGMIEGKSKAVLARAVDFANFSLCQVHERQERPICSATFGMRRDVFRQLDGFDEAMRIHEDIDICHRLQLAGYRTIYQPAVHVLHDHGRASLVGMARYFYSGAREAGLETEEKYASLSPFYRFLLRFKHPLVYLWMVVPFAVAATVETIRINVKEHKEVVPLSPLIFLGKLSCHVGIWRSLWPKPTTTGGVLHETRRALEYSLFKEHFSEPRVLTLFVTSACNARCSHCFYWQNLNKRNDLTFEEIERLSESLGKLDVLLLSGGEPFLRHDLPEICRVFFERNGLGALSIPTNGLLPEATVTSLRRILDASKGRPVHLAFSVDGKEAMHDHVRGVPGAYRRAKETYRSMLPLQREFANLRLRVNTTVFDANYEDVHELFASHLREFPGANTPSLSLLRCSERAANLRLPSEERLRALYEHRNRKCPGERSQLAKLVDRWVFELSLAALRRNAQALPCEAGRILGVVDANGDVRPCELLPAVGNLRRASFGEIWRSPEARAARQRIVGRECFCTHECFLFPSLLAHPAAGLVPLARVLVRGAARL